MQFQGKEGNGFHSLLHGSCSVVRSVKFKSQKVIFCFKRENLSMFEACGYVMLSYDLKNKLEISQYKQIIVIIWEAFLIPLLASLNRTNLHGIVVRVMK